VLYSRTPSITHKFSLGQAFAHCPRFPTAGPNAELEPYSSSDVAVRSPKPATDRKLGRAITSPTT